MAAVLSVSGAIAPVVAGQASGATARVAFLCPGKRGEPYWDMISESMRSAARQLNLSLEIVYAERNYRLMQTLGFGLILHESPPQFLILANYENAGAPLLEAADVVGVHTLLVSSNLLPADLKRLGGPREKLTNWIGSLIPDIEVSGARMARHLIAGARQLRLQSSDGKIHLLAINGEEQTPTSIDRQRGLEHVVAAEPDVVIDRVLYGYWNAQDAEVLTTRYLRWASRRGIRVAGVWAGNDPMAFGASKALRAAGLAPGVDTLLVGLNWSQQAVREVQDGTMLLTDGGHFLLGLWSLIMLRDHLDGCDPFSRGVANVLPTAAVTRENASRILPVIESGDFIRIDVAKLRAKAPDGHCRPYDFSIDAAVSAIPKLGGK